MDNFNSANKGSYRILNRQTLDEWIEQQRQWKTLIRTHELTNLNNGKLENAATRLSEQLQRGGFEEKSDRGLAGALIMFADQQSMPEQYSYNDFQVNNLLIKEGFDPNKDEPHLGHLLMPYRVREFQEHGAIFYLLMGTFTAMYGDPTDKDTDRAKIPLSVTKENSNGLVRTILPAVDADKTRVFYNHQFYEHMTVDAYDYLCSKLPLKEILAARKFRDDSTRSETSGASLLYGTLQGIDSVFLGSMIGSGGADQTLNEKYGRIIQAALGMEDQLVLTGPILLGTDNNPNNKMSKSAKPPNVVRLGNALETYSDLMIAMNMHPELTQHWGEIFTEMCGLETYDNGSIPGAQECAGEITRLYWGDEKTAGAVELYDKNFLKIDYNPTILGQDLVHENLDDLVDSVLSKQDTPTHELLNSLNPPEYTSLSVGKMKEDDAVFGVWDKEFLEKIDSKDEKVAISYFNVSGDTLHAGHLHHLTELKEMQEKGYKIKIILGDYTTGTVLNGKKANGTSTDEIAAQNTEKLKAQIADWGEIDQDRTEFIQNSEQYKGMLMPSLYSLYSNINLRELETEGLLNLSKDANRQKNVLNGQYDIRKALDVVLLASQAKEAVLVTSEHVGPYAKIAEYMAHKLELNNLSHIETRNLRGKGNEIMSQTRSVNNIYLDPGKADEMYTSIMHISDEQLALYDRLGDKDPIEMTDEGREYVNKMNSTSAKNVTLQMDVARSFTQRICGLEAAINAEQKYIKSALPAEKKLSISYQYDPQWSFDLYETVMTHYAPQNQTPQEQKKLVNKWFKDGVIKVNGYEARVKDWKPRILKEKVGDEIVEEITGYKNPIYPLKTLDVEPNKTYIITGSNKHPTIELKVTE